MFGRTPLKSGKNSYNLAAARGAAGAWHQHREERHAAAAPLRDLDAINCRENEIRRKINEIIMNLLGKRHLEIVKPNFVILTP